ncbi:hypothetical protein AB0L05_10810 [Nonomuraea pusilla]|uniref:hypothetical protein n=1 Tax=Nonomuraea pusilla TaxID=46177 RepID=UPI0033178F72
MTIDQYARAVRAALADHPEREELLEDLDDHLAEIAAESGVPLEERLGPPEAYAEELVAAYGGRPHGRVGRRPGLRERARGRARDAHRSLLRHAPYRGLVGFLPELRPGWWVLRGYLLAMVLVSVTSSGRIAPQGVVDWVVVAAAVYVSVWFGRRRHRGRAVPLAAAGVNAVAGLALLLGLMQAAEWNDDTSRYAYSEPAPDVYVNTVSAGDGVYNIKPYAKDGTPLTDVYLYDQDGKPVTTEPENYGYTVDRSCGEPILNRYPLPLVPQDDQDGSAPMATPCPSASPSQEPMASARPSPSSSEPPAASPSASPTGGPRAGRSG